jgi:hypothetical protein
MTMHQLENFGFRNPTNPILSTAKLAICATAAFAIAGCQAIQLPNLQNFQTAPGPGPNMAPAPLPTANVGDKFYYSNGTREQVVSVDGEMVNLISSSNRKLTNFRNFMLPQPYIEGADKEYLKRTHAPTNVLWPLSVGQSTRFSTDGRTVSKNTGAISDYNQKWTCEVAGTEHVRVLAGEFDTYRVECKRYSPTGRWWQNRTWYYAPAIGTYVLRRDFHKKNGEQFRQLTAVRPSLQNEPDKIRQNIIHTWQLALENKQRGEIQSWADKKTGTSVQVEPLVTYRARNGQFCRTYKQHLTRQGNTHTYMGVACRHGKLQWRTPARG